MKNTICEKCQFSNTADSEKPCVYDIPNLIKDIHKVDIVNNYYQLNNYQCRYGFSKETYNANIDQLQNIDIQEYIRFNSQIQYSLWILLENNTDYKKLLKKINNLPIIPHYLFFICYDNGFALSNLLSNNKPYINFKIGHFLQDITQPQALHILFETNKNKAGAYMWILNEQDLYEYEINESILNINFMINVEQKPAHYYKYKNIDSNLNGIFIHTNNYYHLSKSVNYTINKQEDTLVLNYE
jgi:hypothetical protein